MSRTSRPRHWWADTPANARRGAVGAVVLVVALATTSLIVWTTPSVSPVTQVSDVVKALNDRAKLTSERDELAAEVASLTMQIDAKNTQIDAFSAKLAISQSQAANMQGDLSAANQSVASLQTQVSQLQGRMAALTPRKKTPTKTAVAAVTAPTKQQLLNPASPYFGMYTEQAPFNFATFDSTAAKVGAEPSSVGYFQGWDKGFRADAVTSAWQRNMLPIMTWESRPIDDANGVNSAPSYSLPKIIAGDFDAYLTQYAQAIVATGLPMGIRLDHEMNATWYPWAEDDGHGNSVNGNSQGDYVKMWKHVHDIFQAQGANQYVIWIWAPNRVDNLPVAHRTLAYTQSLYPGDDQVDWIGMSGYMRPPFVATQKFSFDETFGATLPLLRGTAAKPIFLTEVGASETGGHKATWVTNFFAAMNDPQNADIIGFAWFDLAITSLAQGTVSTNDWRIDSSQSSLDAFTAGLFATNSRFHLAVPK